MSHVQHGRRGQRLARGLVIGLGVVALLGACSSDGPLSSVTTQEGQPESGDSGGGSDTGSTDGGSTGSDGGSGSDSGGGGDDSSSGGDDSSTGGGDSSGSGGDTGTQTEPASDDGLSTEEWVALILIGIAGLAIIIGAVSLAQNHSDNKAAKAASDRKQLENLIGLGRWTVDQGSVDVLRASEAHQLETSWRSARDRSIDLENRSSALAASIDDEAIADQLTRLSGDAAALRGALEGNVSLRMDPNASEQQALIDDSTRSVNARRQDVQTDLARLSALRS